MPSSTTTIKYNEGHTLNVMVPLISFNCLFDTEVGLIKLINKNFNDPRVFDTNTLDSLDSNLKVTRFVFNSTSDNILLDILKDKDIEVAKEYYKQFMEQEYDNILINSVYTDLVGLLETMESQPDVKASIYCLNKTEVDFIHKYLSPDIQAVTIEDIRERFDMYKQFYFRSIVDDPYLNTIYKGISKSFVYILDYRRNFDNEGKLKTNDIVDTMEKNLVSFGAINAFTHNLNNQGDNKT